MEININIDNFLGILTTINRIFIWKFTLTTINRICYLEINLNLDNFSGHSDYYSIVLWQGKVWSQAQGCPQISTPANKESDLDSEC